MSFISKLVKKHKKQLKNFRREIIINQIVRDLINLMVIDVIETTKKNLRKNNPQSINDIYKHDNKIVHFSNKVQEIDNQVKDFLKKNMYNNKKVIVNTDKGKIVIRDLFKYLLNDTKKYISNELLKNEPKERLIADFIAGMTDRYAINLHKKIK
jgi:dGTPase